MAEKRLVAERYITSQLDAIFRRSAFETRKKKYDKEALHLKYISAVQDASIITAEEYETLELDEYWQMFTDMVSKIDELFELPIPMDYEIDGDCFKVGRKKD